MGCQCPILVKTMTQISHKKIVSDEFIVSDDFWSDGILDSIKIINRTMYRGRGRPRKTDYVVGICEAQKIELRMLNRRFNWQFWNKK